MSKKVLLSVALMFALSVLTGCQLGNRTPKVGGKVSYKIGGIAPLTGGGANLGQPYANGVEMAVAEINSSGGINGHNLEANIQDGKLDSKESLSATHFLLEKDNPDIFLSLLALPSLAISPVLKEAKKPMIYQAYVRDLLSDNPYAFKANFDALGGCEQLVSYAKDNGKYTKLGALLANVGYSEECLVGVKRVAPDIKEYRYTYGDTDFKTLLAKANSDGVDRLLFFGVDLEIRAMFKQLTELGYPIKIMCSTSAECIFPDIISSTPAAVLDGTLGIDFAPADIGSSDFAKMYKSKYPAASLSEVVWGAIGYEDVMYISKAMGICTPGDSQCLTNALEKVSGYKSVLGSRGFVDRVLQLDNRIYDFEDGAWQLVK